jgi:hypothetical protein
VHQRGGHRGACPLEWPMAAGRGFGAGENASAGRAPPKELGTEARGGRQRDAHESPNARPKQAATLTAALPVRRDLTCRTFANVRKGGLCDLSSR